MALNDRLRRGGSSGAQTRLPCGRTVDGLWEQVRAGGALDPHVAGCVHCRTTADGLAALELATEELVAEDLQAPTTLLDTIMRVVRTEARRGRTLPLFGGPDAAQVSERAVAGLVRFVVDSRTDLVPVHVEVVPGAGLDLVDVAVLADVPGGLAVVDADVEHDLRDALGDVLGAGLGLRLGLLRVQVRDSDAAS